MMAGAAKIQDYAVIGNGRSAALISRFGSIDWLCWPQFDSASLFAAILDPEKGGHWSIRPVAASQIERRYLEDTNVLETRFHTSTAEIALTDFMPVTSEEDKRRVLWPENEIIRRLECQQGEAEVAVDFVPRPDFARARFDFKDGGAFGLRIDLNRHVLSLRGDAGLAVNGDRAFTRLKMKAGDVVSFSLTFSSEAPAVIPPLGDLVREKLEGTVEWWRHWVAQSNYRGPCRQAVTRSALVLKLLSFSPSGAIVAAPTTSLPEKIGGDHNWDYRFAWLRDAAFTVRALFGLGYEEDAEAFVNWLFHATRLTRPELRVLYDVYGERPPNECSLDHFAGYANSAPVRLGNAASDQAQLDVYG